MAKCVCCENKIGLREESYYIQDPSSPFCENCIKPIKNDINVLINSKEESEETNLALNNLKAFAENKNPKTKEVIKNAVDKYSRFLKNKEVREQYSGYSKEIYEQNERLKSITFVETKNVMITTSNHFEGYTITDYIDVIGGDVALGTGFLSETGAAIADLMGEESGMLSEKMQTARNSAILRLKKMAIVKGANAVIGVNFDFNTMARNMIGISATGTAVIIEKSGN